MTHVESWPDGKIYMEIIGNKVTEAPDGMTFMTMGEDLENYNKKNTSHATSVEIWDIIQMNVTRSRP